MEDTVVKVIRAVAARQPDKPALLSKNKTGAWETITYSQMADLSERFGAGLLALGVQRGDHVGIIADNRKEWIIADQGILGIGAADVPRGSDTLPDEMRFILAHAECSLVLAEDAGQVKKIMSRRKDLPLLKTIIVMDEEFAPSQFTEPTGGIALFAFAGVMDMGKAALAKDPPRYRREMEKGTADELATLIYTSGTTGEPKGVMLSNGNFLHNLRTTVPQCITVDNRDCFLSVLPVWHSFERTVEYIVFRNGASLAYSKLIGKVLMADMLAVKPTVMAAAPRIWESVSSGIFRKIKEEGGIKAAMFTFFVKVGEAHTTMRALVRGWALQFHKRFRLTDFLLGIIPYLLLTPFKALGNVLVFKKVKVLFGGRFRFSVSGGGALPPYVDRFFQAVGVLLLEGYGLTETAPVVSVRLETRPVVGTIGPVLDEMEVKLLDPESGKPVGPGKKGVIYLKGPNIMKGYYKRPDKTAEVLSHDGWLNTGDLGVMTHRSELRILGRTKETIVLLGGENVEPVPIEDTILQSEFIDQVMVVGQDQKFLGALVIPNIDALEKYAKENEIEWVEREDLFANAQILEHYSDEINSRVNEKKGFRLFERVFRFTLIPKHFEVGCELTIGTQKLKRDVVNEMYKKEIAGIFAK
jgi:long-chain acyl-CoA synthetase